MPDKKQKKPQTLKVDLKKEKERIKRSIAYEGGVHDPLDTVLDLDAIVKQARGTRGEDILKRARELGIDLDAPNKLYMTPEERTQRSSSFSSQLEKLRKEQADKRKILLKEGESLSVGERVGGLLTQGIKDIATGAYALPYKVIGSGMKDPAMADEIFGSYGQSVRELARAQEERRAQLGALPKDATTVDKGLTMGADIVGQLAPVVLGSMTGIGAATAATGAAILGGVGREDDPVTIALDAAFAAAGVKAGQVAESGAKYISALALPKDSLGSRIARQFVGRTMAAGGGAFSAGVEGEIRNFSSEENMKNILLSSVMDGLFFSGKMSRAEIRARREELAAAFAKKPITENLFNFINAFMEDEGGSASVLSAAERLNNLLNAMRESKAVYPNGDPILLVHGTAAPAFPAFDTQFFNRGLRSVGVYMTQDTDVASGYPETKAPPSQFRLTESGYNKVVYASNVEQVFGPQFGSLFSNLTSREFVSLTSAVRQAGQGDSVDFFGRFGLAAPDLFLRPAEVLQYAQTHLGHYPEALVQLKKDYEEGATTKGLLRQLDAKFGVDGKEAYTTLWTQLANNVVEKFPTLATLDTKKGSEEWLTAAKTTMNTSLQSAAKTWYTQNAAPDRSKLPSKHLIPMYADIRNPLDIQFEAGPDGRPMSLQDQYTKALAMVTQLAEYIHRREPERGSAEKIATGIMKELGFTKSNVERIDNLEAAMWNVFADELYPSNNNLRANRRTLEEDNTMLRELGFDGVRHFGGGGKPPTYFSSEAEAIQHAIRVGGVVKETLAPAVEGVTRAESFAEHLGIDPTTGTERPENLGLFLANPIHDMRSGKMSDAEVDVELDRLDSVNARLVQQFSDLEREGISPAAVVNDGIPANAAQLVIHKVDHKTYLVQLADQSGKYIPQELQNFWNAFAFESPADAVRYVSTVFDTDNRLGIQAVKKVEEIFAAGLLDNQTKKIDIADAVKNARKENIAAGVLADRPEVHDALVDLKRNWGYWNQREAHDQFSSFGNMGLFQSRAWRDVRQAWADSAAVEAQPARTEYMVLGHTVWIAFDPEQVKSAYGNRGEWKFRESDQLIENVADSGPTVEQREAAKASFTEGTYKKLWTPSGTRRRFYHGTTAAEEIVKIDFSKLDPEALYGPGFYMTASADTGSSYSQNKWKGLKGAQLQEVYEAELAKELKARGVTTEDARRFVNGDEPNIPIDGSITTEAINAAHEGVQRWAMEQTGGKPAVYPLVVRLVNPFDADEYYDLKNFFEQIETARPDAQYDHYWREAKERLWDLAARSGNGTSSFGANLFQALTEYTRSKVKTVELLKEMGFDGLVHTGGQDRLPVRFTSKAEAAKYAEETGGILRAEDGTYYVEGHQVAIAWYDWQVKSDIGNKGEYSKASGSLVEDVAVDGETFKVYSESVLRDIDPAVLEQVAQSLGFEGVRSWTDFYERIGGLPESEWYRLNQEFSEAVLDSYAKMGSPIPMPENYRSWASKWDWGQKLSDGLQTIKFKVKSNKRGTRLYTTRAGIALHKALRRSTTHAPTIRSDQQGGAWGVNISIDNAVRMLGVLESTTVRNDPELQDVINQYKASLREAMDAAYAAGHATFDMVVVDPKISRRDFVKTLRHERAHGWQYGLTGDYTSMFNSGWFETNEAWVKVRNYLYYGTSRPEPFTPPRGRYQNQSVDILNTEVLAHLVSGDYKNINMTPREAAKLFADVLDFLVAEHGVDAVKSLGMSPHLRRAVDELNKRNAGNSASRGAANTFVGGAKRVFGKLWDGRGPERGSDLIPENAVGGGEFENIDAQFQPPGWRQRVKDSLRRASSIFDFDWTDTLTREINDSTWPIIKTWAFLTEGQSIRPGDNAQMLMRNWLGISGKISQVFRSGMVNGRDEVITPGGVKWLFEPFEGLTREQVLEESEATIHYMVSQRTIDLHHQRYGDLDPDQPITGIGGGDNPQGALLRDVAAARRKLDQIQARDPEAVARIEEAANRYRQWARSLIDYAYEKGLIKEEQHAEMVANGDYYVDLHRLFEDNPDSMIDFGGRKYGRVRKLYRELKGSGEVISNPYVNLMAATASTLREADRNQAMNAFVAPLREIISQLENDPTSSIEELAMYKNIGHRKPLPGKDTVTIFRDGVKEHWDFHPEVYAAIMGLRDQPASHLIMNLLTWPLQALRGAITHSPGFQWRNFWRDSQQRAILSETGSKPWAGLIELGKTMWPSATNMRDSFFLGGASQAGHYLSSRVDYQGALWDAIGRVSSDGKSIIALPEKLFNFFWNTVPEAVENSNRMAEWQSSYDKSIAEGMSDYDARVKASFDARNLMDFAVSGSAIKWLNKFVLFLNPAIQSLRRTKAGIQAAPLPFISRWALYALTPTLGEMAWNYSQGEDSMREWQQLQPWRKDFFFNLRAGDTWITIPKPFEMGVAASLANRLVDRVYFGNEFAFEGAVGSALKALLPMDESAIFGPFRSVIEAMTNYNWFYDDHIVPVWEEKRDPDLAASRATSVATTIGRVMDTDPRYVDHVMRGTLADWAIITNHTVDLVKQALTQDKAAAETGTRLANVAAGNILRPFRPDQANDVKAVMNTAFRMYGERSKWYEPLVEELRVFREADDPAKKTESAKRAVLYATHIRTFLPAAESRMQDWMNKVEDAVGKSKILKDLERSDRLAIDRAVRSEVRLLLNELLTKEIQADALGTKVAQLELSMVDIPELIKSAYEDHLGKRLTRGLEKAMEPPLPGTKRR